MLMEVHQAARNPAAIGAAHGRHHDSHHCCSYSATWRRRLIRPWTLVRQAISLTNFASRCLLVGLAAGQTTEVAGPVKKRRTIGAPSLLDARGRSSKAAFCSNPPHTLGLLRMR